MWSVRVQSGADNSIIDPSIRNCVRAIKSIINGIINRQVVAIDAARDLLPFFLLFLLFLLPFASSAYVSRKLGFRCRITLPRNLFSPGCLHPLAR
jgi:hypothetical protein